MASYRIKLSDGTTTLDLYSATDYTVLEGGLSMPPPRMSASYIYNPFKDGGNLASANYENRIITLNLKLIDTTLANLKTNIRAIQRLINDARERTLLGYGSQVYLEYQWGDSANESTFFDVLHGDLILPKDYLSALMSQRFSILNAQLVLTCKPFGRYTNQTVAQDTLENMDYSTSHNYKDITTTEAYGDVPARLWIEITQTGATGSKKLWITKRSGTRYNDDLWVEGEDETSSTNIQGNATFSDVTLAACSGGKFIQSEITGTDVAANNEISRHNYDMATPPRGRFRVLIMARNVASVAAEYDHMSWGFGWSYGDKTYTPSEALGEYYECSADSTWEILDLGILDIPPIAESDIAANNTFQLRIYQYNTDTLTAARTYDWGLDYIFLLPMDEGVVIIDDVDTADVIVIDGITDPPNVFVTDTTATPKIEDYPDYVGAPFSLGRETTRIYILRDDVPAVTFAVDIKYQPQFLVI